MRRPRSLTDVRQQLIEINEEFVQLQKRIDAVRCSLAATLAQIFDEQRPAFSGLAEAELVEKIAVRVVARLSNNCKSQEASSIPSAPTSPWSNLDTAKPVTTDPSRPTQRFIRLRDILQRIPVSRSQIYKRIADGNFPKPLHMGGRSAFWLESEVDAWIKHFVILDKH